MLSVLLDYIDLYKGVSHCPLTNYIVTDITTVY